jgi:hypothetical protein
MSDNHEKHEKEEKCEMCALTKRIFGDRFAGCADITNHATQAAFAATQDFFRQLVREVDVQHNSGIISDDDFKKVGELLSKSIPSSAALVPAIFVLSGVGEPHTMLQEVEFNLRRVFEIQLKENPIAILEMLAKMAKAAASESDNTESEEEEPVSLSNLN